ncbi:MAG: DUF4097 family beta strand repeat protein [Clostridia bacterium]|nr:DUF4097 family beta strand repeat protein [Clostridia bacterium]
MKKTFLIIAVIVIIAGIALIVGALIASGFDLNKLSGVRFEEKSYSVDGDFDKIEIKVKETNIVFELRQEGGTLVKCQETETMRYEVNADGGVLKISGVDQRKWYERIGYNSNKTLTIYLPKYVYESLTVKCGTGDISVPGQFSFGNADVVSGTGDISWNASVSDSLKLTSSTGKITAGSVGCSGDVSVAVSTGRVVLTDIACRNLTSKGSTGDITLKNVVAFESLTVERSTGDVTLDGCDAVQIAVKTSTGDVKGSLLSEKIFITRTTTGRVKVPETTSGGKCEITTTTGNIDILIK